MRIKNKGVYLVCWFNRYFRLLFEGYSAGKLPVLFYFGLCHTAFEALFLRFLAKLPIDVLEIYPSSQSLAAFRTSCYLSASIQIPCT